MEYTQSYLVGPLSSLHGALGKVVGAFVMPHGGIAIAPWNLNTTNQTVKKEADEIHDACVRAGTMVRELDPDIVLLSTPHGIADLNDFVFYFNPLGSGSADTDNCACPPCCFNVSVQLEVNMTHSIVTNLRNLKVAASALSAYGPPGESEEPFPLKWGEVIPLHFLLKSAQTKPFHVVVISQPSRRYTDDVKMIPELLQLGKHMYELLESVPQRVAVVISGDLAHTHSKDGPYGYSPTAEPFDLACGRWVEFMSSSSLLVDAAGIVDKALSCGFTGFVMLQGLFEESSGGSWTSELLVNHHPSYYGMLVGAFHRL